MFATKVLYFSSRQKLPKICYYKVLGVSPNATIDEIKVAFRTLSKETHPDTSGSNATIEQFKSISAAATILTNPHKKFNYDKMIAKASGYGMYDFHSNNINSSASNSTSSTGYRHPFAKQSAGYSYYDYFENNKQNIEKARMYHYKQQQEAKGFRKFLEATIGQPYNLILYPILIYVTMSIVQYIKEEYIDPLLIDPTTKREQQNMSRIIPKTSLFRSGDNERVQAWYNPISDQYETPAPWDPYYQKQQPELELVPKYMVVTRTRDKITKFSR